MYGDARTRPISVVVGAPVVWDIPRHPLQSEKQIVAYLPSTLRKKAQCPMIFCRFWPVYSYMEDSYLLVSSEREGSLAGPGCGPSCPTASPEELAENTFSGICDGKQCHMEVTANPNGRITM